MLNVIGKTDKGIIRDNNEDNIYVDGCYVTDITIPSAEFYIDEERINHTFAVCDGIGGADCGEIASLAAVKALHECDLKGLDNLSECIFELNHAVLTENIAKHIRGMGSTVALVHVKDDMLHFANVGDSRIYLCSGGELKQLSVDHTRIQMMKDAGINDVALLKRYEHQLSQSLGISDDDFVIEPATGCRDLKVGDIVLLCSDGITDVISDEEIQEILTQSGNAEAATIANKLFDLAIEKKTKDNISLIIIKANREDCK